MQIYHKKINKRENFKNQKRGVELNREYLNIAVKITGGLGDLIVAANYLNALYLKLNTSEVRLYLFAHKNIEIARAVFRGMRFVHSLKTQNEIEDTNKNYDLFIEIGRYPFVRHKDINRIQRYSSILTKMIFLWERFYVENKRFWYQSPYFDGLNQVEIIRNRKRIQQPDVYSYLGVNEKFEAEIIINKNEQEYLEKLKLSNKKFITIHRGVDNNKEKDSNKLWPQEYYSLLVQHLKNKYPDIVLVQLGYSEERCPAIPKIDIYLAGKTDLEDVKILLKKSSIHIDGEGGFVHLRHALHGGKSIVLFGPTSSSFFGYSENINLRQTACACEEGCEWISSDWQSRCIAGYTKNACMYSITPEFVLKNIEGLL